MKPEELLYAQTHEWTSVAVGDGEDDSGAKIVTVGISAFAVEALTDLVYIQLPEIGQTLKAGESFGEIESVKAVSDLYSPVAGEVVAVNDTLPNNLEVLGEDPFGQGWMLKIKVSDEAGLAKLMDFSAYQKQCAEEGEH